MRVRVFTSGDDMLSGLYGSLYSADALILTARLRTSSGSVRSFSPLTSTTDAAPSPVGPHIGSVFGHEMTSAFMTSSRVNALRYCAYGLSVECAWLFTAILANCSMPTPSL